MTGMPTGNRERGQRAGRWGDSVVPWWVCERGEDSFSKGGAILFTSHALQHCSMHHATAIQQQLYLHSTHPWFSMRRMSPLVLLLLLFHVMDGVDRAQARE